MIKNPLNGGPDAVMPKYQFVVEIPFAPDDAAAWLQVKNIAREGRLGEFVVQVQRVTEIPAPEGVRDAITWKAALRPKRVKKQPSPGA